MSGSDLDVASRPPGDGSGRKTAIGCSVAAILAAVIFWIVRALVIG